jgi:hypothetical protein
MNSNKYTFFHLTFRTDVRIIKQNFCSEHERGVVKCWQFGLKSRRAMSNGL